MTEASCKGARGTGGSSASAEESQAVVKATRGAKNASGALQYPRQNRFRVDQETYRRKVVVINRKIKCFMRSIDAKIVDFGRRCFTPQRVGDGVHFTLGGQNNLCQTLNNMIRAFVHRSSL